MATGTNEWRNFERLHDQLNSQYGSRTLYEALGVKPDATEVEIRRSYRKKALLYHPDRNKEPGAEQKFKDVQSIYEVLSSPEKRAAYESWLRLQGDQREARQQSVPYSPQHNGSGNFTGAGFSDLEARVKACANGEMSVSEMLDGLNDDQASIVLSLMDKYMLEDEAYLARQRQRERVAAERLLGLRDF